MAGLDEKLDVGVHERHSHSNVGTVREDAAFMSALLLDTAMSAISALTCTMRNRDERGTTYKLKI